jgi:DNA-directed RNA polymerase specialized sigma24 family protein
VVSKFLDTLVAAWRGLAGFDDRSSLRTWLYRIATNRCLPHFGLPGELSSSR